MLPPQPSRLGHFKHLQTSDQRDVGDLRRFRKAQDMIEKIEKIKPRSTTLCQFLGIKTESSSEMEVKFIQSFILEVQQIPQNIKFTKV